MGTQTGLSSRSTAVRSTSPDLKQSELPMVSSSTTTLSKKVSSRKPLPVIVYIAPFILVMLVAFTMTKHRAEIILDGHRVRLWNLSGTILGDNLYLKQNGPLNNLTWAITAIHSARLHWPRRHLSGTLKNEVWEKVKNDVVIGVKTGHEVAEKRLNALRNNGWWSVGRDIPNLAIFSDATEPSLGTISMKQYGFSLLQRHSDISNAKMTNSSATSATVALPFSSEEELRAAHMTKARGDAKVGYGGTSGVPFHWFSRAGWRGDKDKNLPAFHALQTAFPNKKWYVLLDDDTYIFLENFARYILQDGMDDVPIYTGKVFYMSRCGGFERDGSWKANKSEPRGVFAHGGSGIVMNGLAMTRLYPAIIQCMRDYTPCWAGDIQVGLCLRRTGVFVRKTGTHSYDRHFTPFCPSKALADRRYSSRWKSEDEPLSFHKIEEHEQKHVSDFERKVALKGDTVVYSELRHYLLSHGVLPRHTAKERRNNFFSTEFLPKHLKNHVQRG